LLSSQQQQANLLLPPTGHPTGFMTHHRFFRTGGAGARGGAGGYGGSAGGYATGGGLGNYSTPGGGSSTPAAGFSGSSFGTNRGAAPSVPRLGGR
jgi:hypothetical protein